MHERSLPFANEREQVVTLVPIDTHQVAQVDLIGSQQVGQRIDDVSLYGALQMPGTVALVRAFPQKKVASGLCYTEEKLPSSISSTS